MRKGALRGLRDLSCQLFDHLRDDPLSAYVLQHFDKCWMDCRIRLSGVWGAGQADRSLDLREGL
ncbi:hypothetical protein GCM10010448_69710 [Streptomyces glomeratus]|uniref:Uncharacterized protein n=1 Tax=Streptomyces glomeratus TaxID=284452 RepID=A0ABP6M584_9ACTN